MKSILRHIVSLIFAAFVYVCAGAQEPIDVELDRYEETCRLCLDLKTRLANGEQLSREEAKSIVDLFVAMNRRLKSIESGMTAYQRQRFNDVGIWFTTGVQPVRPPAVPSVMCMARRDQLSYSSENLLLVPDSWPSRKTPVYVPSRRFTILAECAVPDLAYGIRAGIIGRRFGGYASFRSNFVSGDAMYECTSDGRLPSGSMMWAGGEERAGNMTATAGLLGGITGWMTAYVGAGYGWRYLQWRDIDGNWAEVSDYSHRGLAVETGLIFSYRKLALSVGISSISFKTAALTCGIGICL